jgi:hypothetical protein
MPSTEVSKAGIAVAFLLTILATVGGILIQYRGLHQFDVPCLIAFGGALLTLAGAVVNFEPARILK